MLNAKNIFEKLTSDVNSVLFTEEKIYNNLFEKLKKSAYVEDKKLVNAILALENFDELKKEKTLTIRLDDVEKQEIDRSTLYSIDRLLQLFHADVADP